MNKKSHLKDTMRINDLITAGRTAYLEHRYDEGVEYFKEALHLDSEHVYALQCVSQYYLMKNDFENAKPICIKLIDAQKLSALSFRKFKKMAAQNEDPCHDYVLKHYMHVEAYEDIQRTCRKMRYREKETYQNMFQMYKDRGEAVPFKWYYYMTHNMLNSNELDDVWKFLEIMKSMAIDDDKFNLYAATLSKYGLVIENHDEIKKVISLAHELLKDHQDNIYLLSALNKLYDKLGMVDERAANLVILKYAYEDALDQHYDKYDGKVLRKRIVYANEHARICDELHHEHRYDQLLVELIGHKERLKKYNEKYRK